MCILKLKLNKVNEAGEEKDEKERWKHDERGVHEVTSHFADSPRLTVVVKSEFLWEREHAALQSIRRVVPKRRYKCRHDGDHPGQSHHSEESLQHDPRSSRPTAIT